MSKFRQSLKFFGVILYIGGFFITTAVVTLVYAWRSPMSRRKILQPLQGFWCRKGLRLMGFQVNLEAWDFQEGKNYLIVCNHLSYLDILILAAHVNTSFVTSVEIKETPFLGLLTQIGGCLYVERRNRQNLVREISELTEALKSGLNVTVFPEATSTNGESVLRFRRPLYEAAIQSGKPVKPLCLNYLRINDKPLTRENRDDVFWYDDMPFFSHLWNLMAHASIEVELVGLQNIPTLQVQESAHLAQTSFEMINQRYSPVF